MPTIELDSVELIKLQSKLRREEITPREPIPDVSEYMDNGGDLESYLHEFALDKALEQILEACPICGSATCDRGIAYVGASPIHADQHPEAKAEQAMDEPRGGGWL
jgi:hypothetical protein